MPPQIDRAAKRLAVAAALALVLQSAISMTPPVATAVPASRQPETMTRPLYGPGDPTTELVSVSTSSVQGNLNSNSAAISGDGRHVAFASNATNLVTGDTNGTRDVFVRDRETGVTTRVSVSSAGLQGNGESSKPAISDDGRYVAFESTASNLVSHDSNGMRDIFVRDRQAGTTTRVSVKSNGQQGNNASYSPSISGDGLRVAFMSYSTNLVTGDTNSQPDVFVRDMGTTTTSRVSVASGGTQSNGHNSDPAISGDGRYIAFASFATNLVAGDTNGYSDIYVRDRQAGTTERISVASDGTQGNGSVSTSTLSGDGRLIAFSSMASNLVPGDTNAAFDVFVHDRQDATTKIISVASDGTYGNGTSGWSSMSGDGRFVAFASLSSNLVANDTNGAFDTFIHDVKAETTEQFSLGAAGAQANGQSLVPSLSDDGIQVAFESTASNLVSSDTNGTNDIFARGPLASVGWSSASLQVVVQRGISQLQSLEVIATGSAGDASVAIDPALAGLVTPMTEPPFDLISGATYDVPMIFDVPASTPPGSYTGDVSITSAAGTVLGTVSVAIEVVASVPGVVPQDVSAPSRDRIATDPVGNQLVRDELLVALEFDTVDPQTRILTIANAHGADVVGAVPQALTYQVMFPGVADLDQLASIKASLESEPDVAFVSVNHITQSVTAVPNDPEWQDDWNEANPDGRNWSMELIHAPSAWDISTGDRQVPIAIIDADFDAEHEDLAANVDLHAGIRIPGPGSLGHATHVAGTACAVGNNNVGVNGVAWACSLRVYEFGFAILAPGQAIPDWIELESHANMLKRMVEAAEGGARVVNMSWGDDFFMCSSPDNADAQARLDDSFNTLGRGIETAVHDGLDVLWVAAAGNDFGCDASRVSPAGLSLRFPDNVITVASVDRGGELSEFSNTGSAVSVAAPGGEDAFLDDQYVLSTYYDCATHRVLLFFDCAPYGFDRGTSMAAPHVTGLAALVLSAHSDFTVRDVKSCIVNGASTGGIAIDGEDFHVIDSPAAVGCHGVRVHDTFQQGDIFVTTGGQFVHLPRIEWRLPDGTLNDILVTDSPLPAGSFLGGLAFDPQGRIYATGYGTDEVYRWATDGTYLGTFGSGYDCYPESIDFDSAGNMYVGQAFCSRDVLKFDPSGASVAIFDVAVGSRGSDWISLDGDDCTLFYTSPDVKEIRRFNVCTDEQLPDWGAIPAGGAYSASQIQRLPGDQVLIAAHAAVLRMAGGSIIGTYTDPNEFSLDNVAPDPDATSLWASASTIIHRFDTASGTILSTQTTDACCVVGMAVYGGP